MRVPVRKTLTVVAGVILGVGLLAGCHNTSTASDQKNISSQLKEFDKTQPLPHFDWSQYRETLIQVETAEAQGVATTTFFYNQGDAEPIKSCPSIGFPIPITSQLTNPTQVGHYSGNPYVLDQSEPNGTYTGDSSGTYVVCVLPNGDKTVDYWEGFVDTEGGPAHYDAGKHQIVDDGSPTVKVKGHK